MKSLPGFFSTISNHISYRWLPIAFAACLAFLAVPAGLHAQALSGINGTVTDDSGAVVPDATVTVTNTATGVVNMATTSSAGTFTVTDLVPGSYTVIIDKPGFQSTRIKGINVEAGGKEASADVVLKTGSAASSTIEVVAQSVTLETSEPNLGTVVESKLVEELPIIMGQNSGAGGRGRQIDNFLFLTPGVTGNNFEHRVNGGVSYQNEVVFNGIDAPQSETQGFQSNINPPYEMVSEFRALTNVFSAQYGLAQGVAYYQLASGTNTLHGDVFEIMRNDFFDARTANQAAHHDHVTVDKEHNFGFTMGGPVYVPKVYHGKDKTFFHFSAEWYRLNGGNPNDLTVPLAAFKQGDFSGLFRVDPVTKQQILVPIYVPGQISAACQAALPAGVGPGQQFPGNKIPQGCFSAASKALLPLIPDPDIAPNASDPRSIFTANKKSQLISIPTRQTSWGFSIDHNLTDRQRLHGSYWRDKYNTPAEDNNAPFSNVLSDLKNEPRIGTGLFLSYSNIFSPSLVMTAGIGWMGEINDEFNAHQNFNFPGVAGGGILPTIGFSGTYGYTGWGVNSNGETFSINRKLGISLNNNWLWTHGRHTMNLGLEVRRTYQDDHECQSCGGSLFFSRRTTGDGIPADVGTTGDGFASFLLGEPNQGFRQFALETKLRNLYFAPYIQDNIKVTTKLTVDVGVRWDILRPFTVAPTSGQPANQIVFFDPNVPNPGAISTNTGQPLLGAAALLGTCPNCAGFNHADIHWRYFSPRLGFAYKLNNKTVLLAGFALNHLDTGPYEYGNNKVANNMGNILAGTGTVNFHPGTVAGYCDVSPDCTWDTKPFAVPQATMFTPTIGNGLGTLRQFSRNPGPIGYVQQWNVGIQREIGFNTLLTVSYLGNRGVHLPSMLNPINQLDPKFLQGSFCPDPVNNCPVNSTWTDPNGQTVLQAAGFKKDANGFFSPYANFFNDFGSGVPTLQALVPYPMYKPSASAGGLFNPFDMNGTATYNALQAQAEKRFTSGLSFLVNYTLSRSMSNTDSGFSAFNFGSLNKSNQKSEWTVSSFDATHIANISTVYELPIGPGKKFVNHGGLVAKNLIGGWQVSGIFVYVSGTPLSITAGNFDPLGNGFNRANYDPSVPLRVNWNNYYKGLPVFNTAAFSDPGFFPGNSPRNIGALRGPWFSNESFALAKKFYFGERGKAELRVEFFNVLNKMLVCGANTNLNDGNFGIVNGGNVCQGNSPRRGQAYFKVEF